jgi:uncharacterized protein YbjT (DUF2867 family)
MDRWWHPPGERARGPALVSAAADQGLTLDGATFRPEGHSRTVTASGPTPHIPIAMPLVRRRNRVLMVGPDSRARGGSDLGRRGRGVKPRRKTRTKKEVGMIAVMGASGAVGSKVANLLLKEKQDVRVFGRSAEGLEPFGRGGAEVVVGDAINVDDLQALFKDAASALVVLSGDLADPHYVSSRSEMSRAITRALRQRKVSHVVLASSIGADRDRGVGMVAGLHELERLLFGLEDANVLSLRAAWHMENLLASLPMIKEQKMNGSAIKGDHRFPMIATVDIAERAARHLTHRDFSGHIIETILGPEERSMNEATRALGAALGMPDLPYVEFPPEGVKAALQGIGMSEEVASLLVELQIGINENRLMDEVRRTSETTTPTGLEEFLRSTLTQ